MKVILANKITTVASSSEHANYPDDNILNDSPKRVWTSNGVDTATLTCSTSGDIDAIAIFNTNADSIAVTISDPNELLWPEDTWDGLTWAETLAAVTIELEAQADNSALWGTFDTVTVPVDIAIAFSGATGSTVQAGVIVIGEVTTFKNPQYGLSQGLIDYSIQDDFANGAFYYKQRDIVRQFSGTILPQRDTEFYTFMHSLARTYGKSPKAWRITDADNFEWVCYARFENMPTGSHPYPTHSPITFSLREVI